MNRTTTTMLSAIAMTVLPSCGSSAPPKGGSGGGPQSPETIAANAPYAVAGVKLMMTPGQADSALRAAGYKEGETSKAMWISDSFEDLVEERLTGKPPAHVRHVPTHQEWKKGQESVTVQYAPYPGDSKVVSAEWKTDDGSPSETEIRTTLEKRYGPGWQLKPFLPEQWCTPKPCSPGSAKLMAEPSGVALTPPDIVGQPISFNKRMDAAVAARVGPSKGAF